MGSSPNTYAGGKNNNMANAQQIQAFVLFDQQSLETQSLPLGLRLGVIIHTFLAVITSPIRHDSAFHLQMTNGLSSVSDLFTQAPLCTQFLNVGYRFMYIGQQVLSCALG